MDSPETSLEKQLIAHDLPRSVAILKDLKTNCDGVSQSVDHILQQVEDGALSTNKGLSFLEVKWHLLLSYLINLTYIMLSKARGKQLEDEPAIERIVEIRTVLERIRPIEQKLKYQIDKLIKTAMTGVANDDDPLRYSANPDKLVTKLGSDSETDSDEEADGKTKNKRRAATSGSQAYVPPKIAAVYYDGDLTEQDRQQKLLEQARKKVMSSSIMQELRQEYYDGPEEIVESRDLHRVKADKEAKDRTRYEEERMVRLNISKKQKNDARRMHTMSSLSELARFGDVSAMLDDDEDGHEFASAPKKKKKAQSGVKRKGKKGFKKRRR